MLDYRHLASLLASLVPIGLSTFGCNTIGDFDTKVCTGTPNGLAHLAPKAGTDFVALRASSVNGTAQYQVTWGTPCLTATDQVACRAALDALPFNGVMARDPLVIPVAFTRGDEVGQATTLEELVALLGSIDTPNEAALVAYDMDYLVPCDQNNLRKEGNAYVLLGTKGESCLQKTEYFDVNISPRGEITTGGPVFIGRNCPVDHTGRRPAGLISESRAVSSVGGYFAEAAHLEAASVIAFAELTHELARHAAPRKLIRAAHRSSAEEVGHARTMARLARRFGARPTAPLTTPHASRSLFDIALDNATEGCVRETFGALAAMVQARRAVDPMVRNVLGKIAVDETRHATFSWALDAWIRERLPSRQRVQLNRARRQAFIRLKSDLETEWPTEIRRVAGIPEADVSLRLASKLDVSLRE